MRHPIQLQTAKQDGRVLTYPACYADVGEYLDTLRMNFAIASQSDRHANRAIVLEYRITEVERFLGVTEQPRMSTARPIKTVYYRHDRAPIVNSSCDPDRAAGQALIYMRANKYDAHTCEVYHADTGKDYASMRWTKAGVLEVREVEPNDHPLAPKR